MASTNYQAGHLENYSGFSEHSDVFPIINSTPITPSQDSLLNSESNFKFQNSYDNQLQVQEDANELIDPSLIKTTTAQPSTAANLNTPFTSSEVDPSLLRGSSNVSESELQSLASGNGQVNQQQRPYQQFSVSKATHQSRTKTTNKVAFVDPVHPQFKHTAVFCCQIPICVRHAKKQYEHVLEDFIKHYSKPTVATPLYGGAKKLVVPEANNPDLRIPMLLLTGARVYRVEKMGGDPIIRLFVSDVTHSKRKYWELLPGGAADQMGWINELRNEVAGQGRSSTWKCQNHAELWKVTILGQSFEDGDGDDGANTQTLDTPNLGTGFDSGYASSASRQVRVSSKKSSSTDQEQGTMPESDSDSVGKDNHEQSSVHHHNQDNRLDEDVLMENALGDDNDLGQIHQQAFESFDIDEGTGGMISDDGGDLLDAEGYVWADDFLEEVNMFMDGEPGSDDTDGQDFDNFDNFDTFSTI